jgi:hypothetical protein
MEAEVATTTRAMGGASSGGDGAVTSREHPARALQRARRSVGSGGQETPLAGYRMQAATIWAILDLTDAVCDGRRL